MNRFYLLLVAFFVSFRSVASVYPEVLFENSLMPKSYYYSHAFYQGASWISQMNGHLPVSDSIFFTPGNALMLHYVSADKGQWEATIRFRNDSGYLAKSEDILMLKLFVASDSDRSALPSIQVMQGEKASSELVLSSYISEYADHSWLSVAIPLRDLGDLDPQAPVSSLVLKQGANHDNKEHMIFVDQIEFIPEKVPDMVLTGKAVLSEVVPYERHVDVFWKLPLTPSIRYIKIYRSEDNKNFYPVGIRPISFNRYSDVVPRSNATYYYKIAWVDYKYRESPFSDIRTAETKIASDEALLDMVEKAHISYFTSRTEFNSGMHKISYLMRDARVSVKGTGIGILAEIVGVERQFIPRMSLISRLSKVTKFLGQAISYHGVFPELLNGRTGDPALADSGEREANLESTAYLMQGLLVARNYLHENDSKEKNLIDQITSLWSAVDWKFFLGDEAGHHLYSSWSPTSGFDKASPLGGYNSGIISYLLAMASPSHPVQKERGLLGCKQPLRYLGPAMGRFSASMNDTLLTSTGHKKPDLYAKDTMLLDSIYYGVPLSVKLGNTSLLNLQQPFLAFNPSHSLDSSLNFLESQQALSTIFYRDALNRSEPFVGLTNTLWPYAGKDSIGGRVELSSALATYPYTPYLAMEALKNYYRNLGVFLWTEYGFRDEVDFKENWVSADFDAVHQGSVPIMLENARTGLLWKLFMKDTDIRKLN